jgi:hypothetical protein
MARYLGRHTIGIDQRTGKKVRYADLVEDGEIKGILTTRDNADREHPQKFARRVPTDRLSIRRPSPEPMIGAVSVIANSGGSADLWEGNQTALHLALVMGEVVVSPAAGLAPVSTIAPVISGTVSQGAQLSTDDGSWDNTPLSYTYQWYADGAAIPGATSSTYQVSVTYVGSILHVVVTAANNNGSASRASDFTSAVTEARFLVNPGSVALSGRTVVLNRTRLVSVTSANIAVAGSSVLLTADVFVGALDALSTAPSMALSPYRRLLSSYTGSLIRVRRSSDNAEQDIGYDGDGLLDTTALTTFTGAGNGFIVTEYDQSGNGHDAGQSTAAAQPQIVSSGSVLTTINGRPSPNYDGTDDFLVTATSADDIFDRTNGCLFGIARFETVDGGTFTDPWQCPAIAGGYTGGNWAFGAQHGASSEFYSYDGTQTSAAINVSVSVPRNQRVYAMWRDNAAGRVYGHHDDGLAGSVLTGVRQAAANVFGIGRHYTGPGQYIDGQIIEVIAFNSLPSLADRNTLGADMAAVAGVSWTNIT